MLILNLATVFVLASAPQELTCDVTVNGVEGKPLTSAFNEKGSASIERQTEQNDAGQSVKFFVKVAKGFVEFEARDVDGAGYTNLDYIPQAALTDNKVTFIYGTERAVQVLLVCSIN